MKGGRPYSIPCPIRYLLLSSTNRIRGSQINKMIQKNKATLSPLPPQTVCTHSLTAPDFELDQSLPPPPPPRPRDDNFSPPIFSQPFGALPHGLRRSHHGRRPGLPPPGGAKPRAALRSVCRRKAGRRFRPGRPPPRAALQRLRGRQRGGGGRPRCRHSSRVLPRLRAQVPETLREQGGSRGTSGDAHPRGHRCLRRGLGGVAGALADGGRAAGALDRGRCGVRASVSPTPLGVERGETSTRREELHGGLGGVGFEEAWQWRVGEGGPPRARRSRTCR